VNAFMKVDSDLFNILKNGSLQGYFWEPHNTVCSRICGTPVLSIGVVRNCMLQDRECREEHSYLWWEVHHLLPAAEIYGNITTV